ncbi:MAG TPA: DNA replication/repair protein RecF [Holosporales bacterium]|nr:DNA replication/repair protein RecF [Holosporales bacterium]
MITKLRLYQFRNITSLELPITKKSIVLYGENGSGKTNILEAISLFSVGKGLRNDSAFNMENITSAPKSGWSSTITLNGDLKLQTNLEPQLDSSLKRTAKIQGDNIRSHMQFSEWLHVLWITPETDQLFLDAPAKRRKFVDRFVYAKDKLHLKRVIKFESATRQRLKLLKSQQKPNEEWLTAIEQTIAEEGVALAFARYHLLQDLSKFQPQGKEEGILTSFTAKMDGPFEDLLSMGSSLKIEDAFRQKLFDNRVRDKESGITLFGPHRSDLNVTHHIKDMNAFQCSTGEQKILLLAMIISFMESVCFNNEQLTIFLLDDAMAHLDAHHRFVLFHRLIANQDKNFQAWFSGTDRYLFKDLEENADFFYVPGLHQKCNRPNKCTLSLERREDPRNYILN